MTWPAALVIIAVIVAVTVIILGVILRNMWKNF